MLRPAVSTVLAVAMHLQHSLYPLLARATLHVRRMAPMVHDPLLGQIACLGPFLLIGKLKMTHCDCLIALYLYSDRTGILIPTVSVSEAESLSFNEAVSSDIAN